MTVLRHIYPKPLDDLFMKSLEWSDKIYAEKHSHDDKTKQPLRPLYSKTLSLYARNSTAHAAKGFTLFLRRTVKRLGLGIILYFLSLVPVVGKLIFPAAGFYSLYRALSEDLLLAAVVSCFGLLLFPKGTFVILVHGWLGSRALTRELLEPYFSRIVFSDSQKREWFHDREGVLLGFGLAFYLALRLPLIGPLVYGVATASAAFLITKVESILDWPIDLRSPTHLHLRSTAPLILLHRLNGLIKPDFSICQLGMHSLLNMRRKAMR
jgi:hypothetical protein